MGNKAQMYKDGLYIDYTATEALTAGNFIELPDGRVGLICQDIANGDEDGLLVGGLIKVEKIEAAMSAGLPVGFDADGSPYSGTASSGCATLMLADADYVLGSVAYDAASTDTHVYVRLNEFCPRYPYFAARTYETKAANYTIDAQDTGKVIQCATDAVVFTMTAVAGIVGCDVIVQNLAADAAALISISPNSNDKVAGPDIAGTDNKDLQNTKTTQIQGDFVRVMAGTDWFITDIVGTWATEA